MADANTQRVQFIDVAKGIGMVLVVLGHVNIAYNYVNPASSITLMPMPLDIFGASFHMPLFFMLAGMTMQQRGTSFRRDFLPMADKRIHQLLVPYALWTLIFTIALTPDQVLGTLLAILYGNNKTLSIIDTNAVLWFLPVMFLATLLFGAICIIRNKLHSERQRVLFVGITLFVCALGSWFLAAPNSQYGYPFGFDVALSGTVFIGLGHYLRTPLEKAAAKMPKWGVLLASLLCGAAVFLLALFNNQFIANPALGKVVMAWGNYGLYPLFLVTAILGSAAMAGFSILLKGSRWLAFVGRNTILFLSIHYSFMLAVAKLVGGRLPQPLTPVWQSVLAVLLVVAGLLGSSLVVPLLNRYFPNLSGKKS